MAESALVPYWQRLFSRLQIIIFTYFPTRRVLREAVFVEMHRGVWLIFPQRAQIGEKRSGWWMGTHREILVNAEWEQLVQLKTLLQTCNCKKDLSVVDGDQQEFGDGGGCEPTGRSWWIQPGGEWEQLVQLKTFLKTCNCAKSKNGCGKDNILVGGYWWWEEQKVDQIASTASYASKMRNSILFQMLTPDSSKNGKINQKFSPLRRTLQSRSPRPRSSQPPSTSR